MNTKRIELILKTSTATAVALYKFVPMILYIYTARPYNITEAIVVVASQQRALHVDDKWNKTRKLSATRIENACVSLGNFSIYFPRAPIEKVPIFAILVKMHVLRTCNLDKKDTHIHIYRVSTTLEKRKAILESIRKTPGGHPEESNGVLDRLVKKNASYRPKNSVLRAENVFAVLLRAKRSMWLINDSCNTIRYI